MQRYLGSMEGAVLSGKMAAQEIQNRVKLLHSANIQQQTVSI